MNVTIKGLYQACKQDIYGYLIRLTRNQTVAEDLTSEVFVSAIKALPNFRGDSDIKTWLFSIARHKWYESIRQEKKEATVLERLACYLQDQDHSTEDQWMSTELITRIGQLLDEEKEQSRNIMLMRLDGYSFYEIAGAFHISESSARVIDFRIRKKIKETLAKEGLAYE